MGFDVINDLNHGFSTCFHRRNPGLYIITHGAYPQEEKKPFLKLNAALPQLIVTAYETPGA